MAPRFIDIDSSDTAAIAQLQIIRNNAELGGLFIRSSTEYQYQLQLMQRQVNQLRHIRCVEKGIIKSPYNTSYQ